jgi:hypothetical protein
MAEQAGAVPPSLVSSSSCGACSGVPEFFARARPLPSHQAERRARPCSRARSREGDVATALNTGRGVALRNFGGRLDTEAGGDRSVVTLAANCALELLRHLPGSAGQLGQLSRDDLRPAILARILRQRRSRSTYTVWRNEWGNGVDSPYGQSHRKDSQVLGDRAEALTSSAQARTRTII